MKQQIWVFKTNIKQPEDILIIEEVLNTPSIHQWTIDSDDCDCVLRVVTSDLSAEHIIQQITNKGYLCGELNN
jgi:hypothetical protein